jgi:hypothetical protein
MAGFFMPIGKIKFLSIEHYHCNPDFIGKQMV